MYAKIYQDIQNRRKNSQHKKKQAAARLLQNSSRKVETTVTLENGKNGIEMQVVKDHTMVTQTEGETGTNGEDIHILMIDNDISFSKSLQRILWK